MKTSALCLGALAAGAVAAVLSPARAQRIDSRRPLVLAVGTPGGSYPTQRVDSRRSGLTKDVLPSSPLRVAWRRSVSFGIDQPALVLPDGTLAVVTSRGDVIFLDEEGEEKAHVSVDGRSVGPGTVMSDGTVVFATSGGDAVGVKRDRTRPRFVSRIGGERSVRTAPLALDDGGAVLATTTDLVAIDAEGTVRCRTTLPEKPDAPLLVSGDKIVAVTVNGTVYGWVPGSEAMRLGSFGGAVDGGAAFASATSLVGVVEGNHVVALDIRTGALDSRAMAPQGLYLGPPSLRPNGDANVLAMTTTQVAVARLAPSGLETTRAAIGAVSQGVLPDGGVAPLVAPSHVGTLVDLRGTIAYASTDGHVGIVGADGAVETLNELPCSRSSRSAGIAGLTPWGKNAFLLACEGGTLVKIVGP